MEQSDQNQHLIGLFIGTIAAQAVTAAGLAYKMSKITLPRENTLIAHNFLSERPISFGTAFPLIAGFIGAADLAILPPILAINQIQKYKSPVS
jgi:hypothetical protein